MRTFSPYSGCFGWMVGSADKSTLSSIWSKLQIYPKISKKEFRSAFSPNYSILPFSSFNIYCGYYLLFNSFPFYENVQEICYLLSEA